MRRRAFFCSRDVRGEPIDTRIRAVRFSHDAGGTAGVVLSTAEGRKVRLKQSDHARLAAAFGADALAWLDREIVLRAERTISPKGGNAMWLLCVYPQEAPP